MDNFHSNVAAVPYQLNQDYICAPYKTLCCPAIGFWTHPTPSFLLDTTRTISPALLGLLLIRRAGKSLRAKRERGKAS